MKTLNNSLDELKPFIDSRVDDSVKIPYEAPKLEIIEVEVEKGFAASLNDYGDETA